MSAGGNDVEALATALAEHAAYNRRGLPHEWETVRWVCRCGAEIDDDPSGVDILRRHRMHAAAAIAAALARAADEAETDAPLTEGERQRIKATLAKVDRGWGGAAMVLRDSIWNILGARASNPQRDRVGGPPGGRHE